MTIEFQIIIDKLTELRDNIYGCGNGRNEVDKFIKQLKRDYGIKDIN